MGIDHGLGGRDGAKSKQRREKKAKKNKVVAMRAITGGKKKEVIFDEKARTEWLSGFHKRKQERRKYGLAMEVSSILSIRDLSDPAYHPICSHCRC
jgi:hypothetical protein